MRKFNKLIQLFQAHQRDQEWCESEEGRKVIVDAIALAPPEVVAECNSRSKRYKALMEEIHKAHQNDRSWCQSEEGKKMIDEVFALAPSRVVAEYIHAEQYNAIVQEIRSKLRDPLWMFSDEFSFMVVRWFELAPPEIRETVWDEMEESGWLPENQYDDVYSLEDIAKRIDVSLEEVEAQCKDLLAKYQHWSVASDKCPSAGLNRVTPPQRGAKN